MSENIKSNTEKSVGLGDTVAKITNTLGIDKVADCGCNKRREKLNELFPYNDK